jgi:hypothetical protein
MGRKYYGKRKRHNYRRDNKFDKISRGFGNAGIIIAVIVFAVVVIGVAVFLFTPFNVLQGDFEEQIVTCDAPIPKYAVSPSEMMRLAKWHEENCP